MQFKRAKTSTITEQATASNSVNSVKTSIFETSATVPKLSFEEIVDNNKLKLDGRNDFFGVIPQLETQQSLSRRQALSVLSPNRSVPCQQKLNSAVKSAIRSEKRQRKSILRSLPLQLSSPSRAIKTAVMLETTVAGAGIKTPTITGCNILFGKGSPELPVPLEENQQSIEKCNEAKTLSKFSEVFCLWEYPKVCLPSVDLQKRIYNEAKKKTSSHQYQLSAVAKNGLLSLEDVIIPAVCYQEERALRRGEKALRQHCARVFDERSINQCRVTRNDYIDHNSDVLVIIACRSLVKEFETISRLDVRVSRVERETKLTQQLQHSKMQSIVEEFRKTQKQRQLERSERRERQMKQKLLDKEKKNKDRKKTFYKNKEMWREIALLMTALSRLEREEKEWISVQCQLTKREEELGALSETPLSWNERSNSTSHEFNNTNDAVSHSDKESIEIENKLRRAMEDMSLNTGRMSQTLRDVLQFVDETEAVRVEIYRKYTSEHQFRGYLGIDNPKLLVRNILLNGI
jgi:hypothetical protein